MQIVPVILSGGIGSRLWPLSRAATPKQLQPLLGELTMIQATATRLQGLEGLADPIVVANRLHVEGILGQLEAVGVAPQVVVAEPVGRNTAPAVALAALVAPPGSVLVVSPADHVVTDLAELRRAVAVAVDLAAGGALVTFGIHPRRPETGYGYIRVGEGGGPGLPVEEFVEKPPVEQAERFFRSGRHLWNSGMFVLTPETALEELERHVPEVHRSVVAAFASRRVSAGVVEPGPEFEATPAVSFDHAVMERSDRAVVVPLEAGWTDVGAWSTLWEIAEKDPDGNVIRGNVVTVDVHGSYLRSGGRLVAVLGLDDVVVVDTGDAVLVSTRDRVQEVRAVVERLAGRPEVE